MPFPVPLFRRGQAKPFGSIPRINLDHPLARGLKFYGYDIGGVVLDLVGGAASTPDASPPPYAVSSSAFGSGVLYPNGVLTGGLSIPSSPAVKAVTAPFTWACGCIQTTASPANSFNRIWGRTANNGSPAPFENWCFQTNVSGVGTSVRSGWSVNSSTEGDSATWNIVANQFTSLLAMFTTPTNVDSYSQGIKQNSTTTSYSSTNTNDNIFFGDPGPATGLGQSFPGFVFYGALWNRALTAAEALLLHQDPYCFLIYPEDEMLATLVGVSSGGNIFNVSVTEAGTASDADSASAVFAAADSESGIAVDTPSASAVFAASDTEAGTAADISIGAWVTSSIITEVGTAADSETVTASFASSITEANSAADSYVNTAVFVASDTEAGSASDSPSSTAVFAASDTEAASAADSESSTGAVISDGVIEAATAAETETAIVTFAAAASEAGSATDASSNTAIFSAVASEAGSAGDAEDANGVFVASDTEAATATDLSNGIIPGPPSTDGPHSNPFFATPGPMTSIP